MTRLIFFRLLILAIFLFGCAPFNQTGPLGNISRNSDVQTQSPPGAPTIAVTEQRFSSLGDQASGDFIGRVVDLDGNPIAAANIQSESSTAVSDKDGWFKLSSPGFPEWIKVTSTGFISRTRAASPGVPVLFRLSPDDGKTAVIEIAGDTMFGRRFFDPNGDDYTADALLPVNPTVDDHMKLLAPIRPLLESADLTVLNLETTLSDQAYFSQNGPRPVAFHATANHVYASYPSSVMALKESGVDLVNMANTHVYDLLEAGLNTTLASLDQAGMLHFGAGSTEANAWTPVIVSSKGQKIAFLGCTALRVPLQTPTRTDVPFVASDVLRKGGAAYCAEASLRSAVVQAKQQADVVIVMIHGGREYDPVPTNKMTYLSEIARQAGASLVIDNRPHVPGGFRWKDQSLIAWTMGTFLADQTVWPALESYMLSVYVREGKVVRAYVEPLIVDGFVPHGLTSELADSVVREAAGWAPGPFVMESGAMEVDLSGRALQKTYTQAIDANPDSGEVIAVPQGQWISGFQGAGKLTLGRDLLWVGSFEDEEVDSASHGAPLWDLSSGSAQIGPDFAYEGKTGIRLARGASNSSDTVTSNLHRLWVRPNTKLSITGMVRIDQGVGALVQLSWYSATTGASILKTINPIEVQEYGTWQPFRLNVQVPGRATALGVYLRVTPPEKGTITADFDNIRVIEWSNPTTQYSPLYNYALLRGSGTVSFSQGVLPGADDWFIPVEQNK